MPRRRDDYPPDWELRSRFVRFVRARGRCEWCGAKDGEPHPATGSRVVLTTAHIYDRDPMACSLLNLAALGSDATWVMTEPSGPPARARRRRARHGAPENVEQLVDQALEVNRAKLTGSATAGPYMPRAGPHRP